MAQMSAIVFLRGCIILGRILYPQHHQVASSLKVPRALSLPAIALLIFDISRDIEKWQRTRQRLLISLREIS